jgi:putative cell wall-binding protein
MSWRLGASRDAPRAYLPSVAVGVNLVEVPHSWLRVLVSRPVTWRLVGMLGVGVLAGGCMPGVIVPVIPGITQATTVSEPLDGADRYSVAVAVSGRLSSRAAVPVVYLVSGSGYADAVAAGPAAARDGGAILFTTAGSLPAAVADELVRLKPARVEVVGPSSAIANSVLIRTTSLLGPGTLVERVSGPTPYATAAALSARSFDANGVQSVFIASADNYWDAVAAGPAAAILGAPLLLVTRNALPDTTAAELRRLGPKRVVVVGGTTSVSGNVVAALQAIVPDVERVSGGDRYATAAAVAARFFPHPTTAVATSGVSDTAPWPQSR